MLCHMVYFSSKGLFCLAGKETFGVINAPIFAAALSLHPTQSINQGSVYVLKRRGKGGEQMVILSKGAGAKRALLRRGGTPARLELTTFRLGGGPSILVRYGGLGRGELGNST